MKTEEQIAPHIFKSYDIRGQVDVDLTELAADQIGRASVLATKAGRIAVACDMREHSPRLEAALIGGITAAGADVVRIGQCSTPMSYFAATQLDVDIAIMVTASHNPGRDNGFKFSKRGGLPMGEGTGLEKVRDLVLEGKAQGYTGERTGQVDDKDVLDDWCRHLTQYVSTIPSLKIVADCGNGVIRAHLARCSGMSIPKASSRWFGYLKSPMGASRGTRPILLKPVNRQHLEGAVLATGADLGVAFDGDGDRLAFVDERAEFVGCDLMTAVFATRMLADPANQGKHILCDLRSSAAVGEAIEAAGGVAVKCRVGHSHVKAAMRGMREGRVLNPSLEGEAIFAGELSGHFFFSDCFTIDTSERAFLMALSLLAEDTRPLSEQVAHLRKYWHSGEINFRMAGKEQMHQLLAEVKEHFAEQRSYELDGVSIESDQWWANVRLSNTEPVVRLTAESFQSPEALAALVAEIEGLIEAGGGSRK